MVQKVNFNNLTGDTLTVGSNFTAPTAEQGRAYQAES